MLNSHSRIVFLMAIVLLAGCVTTERSVFTEKADKQKAHETSTQLARQYIRKRNWDAAKRHLKNALEIDQDSAEVNEAMAMVLQNTGEYEMAETHYKKALRGDGNLSRVRLNYAAFLYNQNRYQEAADNLETVVDDVLYERRDLAFESLGICYMQLKKYAKAEAAFDRAYLMERDKPMLAFRLAEANYQLGHIDKAKTYYDRFRKSVKTQPPAGLLLGVRLARKLGDKNAESSYGLALKNLYPQSEEYRQYQQEFGNDAS